VARALILQTQADAPAGLLEGWARRRGIELSWIRADRDALPDPRDYDAVIALGSGATATGAGPDWVAREIEWLRSADVPVLGICFGAQALAAALGGSVHRLPRPEIGWVTVDSQRLPRGPWMAWHEDGFTLPPGAEPLASNAFGVQAFSHGASLAVQFHPEVTGAIVADWVANDHGDLARAGVDARSLLPPPPAAARAAEVLFDRFAAVASSANG
jgi:GMP synthase-like glutamine amidotransferase